MFSYEHRLTTASTPMDESNDRQMMDNVMHPCPVSSGFVRQFCAYAPSVGSADQKRKQWTLHHPLPTFRQEKYLEFDLDD
jgi:hypothetical protein